MPPSPHILMSFPLSVCFCPNLSFLKNIFIKKNFFFLTAARRILVPQPRLKPMLPVEEEQNLTHWATREVPTSSVLSFLMKGEKGESRSEIKAGLRGSSYQLKGTGNKNHRPPGNSIIRVLFFSFQSGIVPGPPVLSFHSFGKS